MTKINEITEMLETAVADGFIWNVDYKDTKDAANRLYSRERRMIMEDCYLGSPEHLRKEAAPQELYYYTPDYLHLLRGKKFSKMLNAAGDSEFVTELRALRECWGTVADLLAQAKPMIKKGRKPSETSNLTPERTLENTGTCAGCGRNVKLRSNGCITDHGYQVPWGGYGRTQNCFGAGYEPIEVSDRGLRAALDSASRGKLNLLQAILTYEKGDQELTRGTSRRSITVKPGDANYDSYLKMYLELLRRNLINTERSIEQYIRAIADWKISPLPLETTEDFEKRCEAA